MLQGINKNAFVARCSDIETSARNIMKHTPRRLCIALALMACSSAHADIAVIVHPDNPVDAMNSEEVAAVYLGRNDSMRPIDLPEAGGLRNWFYSQVTGRDTVQVNIVRARLIAKMPPVLAANSLDALRRVSTNPRAIAYVDTRLVDSSVKVVLTVATPPVLDRLRGQQLERL